MARKADRDEQNRTPKERAEQFNEELQHAASILKAGSEKIQLHLYPLLQELAGTDDINAWKQGNEYFQVDPSYDGNKYTLFQHVTFNKIPNTSKINRRLKMLEKDPHMTSEQYEKFTDKWREKQEKSLKRNLRGIMRERPRKDKVVLKNYETLIEIMNSSAAWNMATTNPYDSNQNLENWIELYDALNDAYNNDESLFDEIISDIENGKLSIEDIVKKVDAKIKTMRKTPTKRPTSISIPQSNKKKRKPKKTFGI